MGCRGGVGARRYEEVHLAQQKISLARNFQDKIKNLCDAIEEEAASDEQDVTSRIDQLLREIRSSLTNSSQFDDHYWSFAERIKDLLASKSVSPKRDSLLCSIRDKLIRSAPGRLEKAAKAFFRV
jgi:hypothetical protein